MYNYKIKEKFLGHDVVIPGKGFIKISYDTPVEKLQYLYEKKHPGIIRTKKKEVKEEKPNTDE